MFEPKFKQIQTKPACSQRDGRGGGVGELKRGSVLHNRLHLSSQTLTFKLRVTAKPFILK